MNFYNYYLILCNQNDESPSGAAQIMKLSKTAVNNWKKGGLPSDITLQTIASHFDVPIEQFWKCEDIAEKRGFKFPDHIADQSQNKKTATSGDGSEISIDAQKLAGNREELKKLVDRLTDQEVSDYLESFRKTILGQ